MAEPTPPAGGPWLPDGSINPEYIAYLKQIGIDPNQYYGARTAQPNGYQQLKPLWPQYTLPYGQWLFGNIGKGLEPYPGQINPDINSTMLRFLNRTPNFCP